MRKPDSATAVGTKLFVAATLLVMAMPVTSPAAERMMLGEYFNALW